MLFLTVFELKLVFLIHAVNLLMVPLEILSANRVKYLRKPASGPIVYSYLNLLFDFFVIVTFRFIIKTAPADTGCIARGFNSQALIICLPGKIFFTGRL